jgi:hypothetical protein
MTLLSAAGYGLLGGLAVSLLALSAAITHAGFIWPWKDNPDGVWPRLTVYVSGMAVGAIVCGAAHTTMKDAWPAFLLGIAAPSVIQHALSLVEVAEKQPVAILQEVKDAEAPV